jgi:hypothetical protein
MIVDSRIIGLYTCSVPREFDNSDPEQIVSAEQQRTGTEAFRTVIRSTRYSPKEWEIVQQRAAAAGLSPSRYMRLVTLGTPLGRRINHEAIVALNRIGVNLNNMIRLAIRSGQTFIAAEAADVLKRLREVLESFL